MAPQNRLIRLVGLTAVPLTVAAALSPTLATPVILILAIVMLVAAGDAAAAIGIFGGLSMSAPHGARLTRDVEGQITLVAIDSRGRDLRLRAVLALPPEISCPQADIDFRLKPQGGPSSAYAVWTCRPARRGRFALETCWVETPSPLGLWAMRKALPVHGEICVYPNLGAERRSAAALFLNRGGYGVHAQRQVGQGRDFEKLRAYIPGDSYADIHWKATAKRGRPVTKIYQIERTQEVYVLIDSSRLSGRAIALPGAERGDGVEDLGGTTNMLERFVTASLVLAMAAHRQGDLLGLATFTTQVDRFLRARGGRGHFRACRDTLLNVQPSAVTPDFGELFSFVRTRIRRRALLIILTNLDDPIIAEQFAHHVRVVSRQHLVLVSSLKNPDVAPLFEREAASVEDIYAGLGGHLQWRRLRELEAALRRRGISFHQLDNETLSAQLISQYMAVKQRQLL
ncbi:MAG: DUF58 domain-containing protein [Planctomycetaceae bacterium]|nr:DUF58 domain-containing protein [Planctomycetaceae bacterium]